MKTVILIPARYQSSRFPGKPLVQLKGAGGIAKPLIQRSVEAARRVSGVSGVFVTTDDDRIADACTKFGVGVIMTSPECRNGTERCAEALGQLHEPDLVINFQGDALLTPPAFVEALIARMREDRHALVATPAVYYVLMRTLGGVPRPTPPVPPLTPTPITGPQPPTPPNATGAESKLDGQAAPVVPSSVAPGT